MKKRVVETALEHLDKSPRQLAWYLTDTQGYYISESSVYRILKANDLNTSPAYTVLSAKEMFDQPTTRINQLWQTDFTYLKVIHWGWLPIPMNPPLCSERRRRVIPSEAVTPFRTKPPVGAQRRGLFSYVFPFSVLVKPFRFFLIDSPFRLIL